MNKICLFIITTLVFSCSGPVENSNAIDGSIYGSITDAGPQEFINTMSAIRNSCVFCHAEWNTYSQADFVAAGLVVAGNPSASKLYYRNSGAQSGPGPKNMPYGGYPTISSENLSQMEAWINGL